MHSLACGSAATGNHLKYFIHLALFLSLLFLSVPDASAVSGDESGGKEGASADTGAASRNWWPGGHTQGMLTAGWVYADGTASPANRGFRVAYGPFDIGDEYYGWAEFWAAYRKGGDQTITGAGASLMPMAFRYERLGWGPLFDIGLEQRRQEGRVVTAGVIGLGPELVVHLSTGWDFATSVEVDYLTTLNSEIQGRLSFRYHNDRISVWKTP